MFIDLNTQIYYPSHVFVTQSQYAVSVLPPVWTATPKRINFIATAEEINFEATPKRINFIATVKS